VLYKRVSATAVAGAVVLIGLGRFDVASASTFYQCHSDSTLVTQDSGVHGGPARLPGSESGDLGYYYLSLTAGCGEAKGTPVTLTVSVTLDKVLSGTIDADGMCWSLEEHLGYNHTPLAAAVIMSDRFTVQFPAVAGNQYRIRLANLESGVTVTDHSSVDG
jgi:hypothetical protein